MLEMNLSFIIFVLVSVSELPYNDSRFLMFPFRLWLGFSFVCYYQTVAGSSIREYLENYLNRFRSKESPVWAESVTPESLLLPAEFSVGHRLGHGAYGTVYSVSRLSNKRRYAAKVMRKPDSPQHMEPLNKEVNLMVELNHPTNHPNIVKLESVLDYDGNIILLMEHCEGGNLSELLIKKPRLGENEVRKYFRQMVEAVHYMHSHGIVHRDLKLDNIFFTKNKTVKVGDLGLAVRVDQYGLVSRNIRPAGTPGCMAPEVLGGWEYGFKADVFSLGVILFNMLEGRPPYPSPKNPRDVDYTDREDIRGSYSAEAMGLLRSLLFLNPITRPTTSEILDHEWFAKSLWF